MNSTISRRLVTSTAPHSDNRQAALIDSGRRALRRLAERWALAGDLQTRFVYGNKNRMLAVGNQLERMSYLLAIYRAATALFGDRDASLLQWLYAANGAPPFGGLSPIEVILDGHNLNEVRDYLECQLVA